jgi:hypothetical protein
MVYSVRRKPATWATTSSCCVGWARWARPRHTANKTSKTPLDIPEFFMASPFTTSPQLSEWCPRASWKNATCVRLAQNAWRDRYPLPAARQAVSRRIPGSPESGAPDRTIRSAPRRPPNLHPRSSRHDRPLPRRASIPPPARFPRASMIRSRAANRSRGQRVSSISWSSRNNRPEMSSIETAASVSSHRGIFR